MLPGEPPTATSMEATHMEVLLILPFHGIKPALQLGNGPVPLCYCLDGSLLGLRALPEPSGCRVWGQRQGTLSTWAQEPGTA